MKLERMKPTTIGILLTVCLVPLVFLPCAISNNVAVKVDVNLKRVVSVISERYLSVTLDSGLIRDRWQGWDFKSARLKTLGSALAPCYVRIGGTAADYLIFDPTLTRGPQTNRVTTPIVKDEDLQLDTCDGWRFCEPKPENNFTMSAEDWDQINQFSSQVGWRILFDFNVLLSKDNEWAMDNAKLLLDYSAMKGYGRNLDFELGNEPDAFHHALNRTLPAGQLAAAFRQLNVLLHQQGALQRNFSQSHLVGPDVTRPRGKHSKSLKYLRDFLKSAGKTISAATWHQYYINGRTAVLENFTDPNVLDLLKTEIQRVLRVVRRSPVEKVWLGETGSAWGGGARHLSDSYVAGFMWLDKLGLAAKGGIDVVMRQSFFRGHYALLDKNSQPRPDYWLSLLFKRLVGERVLQVVTNSDGKVRLYAHCTSPRAGYPTGSVTVYGMNLHDDPATLSFSGDLGSNMIQQYLLTPHGKRKLQSRSVMLNGKVLKMPDDTSLPSLQPVKLKEGNPVVLPAFTFGFYVFPFTSAKACLSDVKNNIIDIHRVHH